MKRLMILFLLLPTIAFADPFLKSDPNEGAQEYVISCDAGAIIFNRVADADGSLNYDLGTWSYGTGWHTCTATAVGTFEVIDDTTGAASEVTVSSDPAPFQIKIPTGKKGENYIVK